MRPDETVDKPDQVKPPVAQEPQAPDTIVPEKQDTPGVDTTQQSLSADAPQSGRIQESSTDTRTDNIAPVEDSFKRESIGLDTPSVFFHMNGCG